MTTSYWWRGGGGPQVRNFGDELTPLLLKQFVDIDVQWAPPAEADILCSGSNLDVIPDHDWNGYVVGAGQLYEKTHAHLEKAIVLGLREWETAVQVGFMPSLTDAVQDNDNGSH